MTPRCGARSVRVSAAAKAAPREARERAAEAGLIGHMAGRYAEKAHDQPAALVEVEVQPRQRKVTGACHDRHIGPSEPGLMQTRYRAVGVANRRLNRPAART